MYCILGVFPSFHGCEHLVTTHKCYRLKQPRLGAIVTSSCEADESQVGFWFGGKPVDILGADSLNNIEHWFCQKGSQNKKGHVFRIDRFGVSNNVEHNDHIVSTIIFGYIEI